MVARQTPFLALAALASLASPAVGCGSYGTGYPIGAENARPLVLNDAEIDLDCPAKEIRVSEGLGGSFEAVGCGRKAKYKASCYGVSCVVHKDDQVPVPFRDRPTPEETSPR